MNCCGGVEGVALPVIGLPTSFGAVILRLPLPDTLPLSQQPVAKVAGIPLAFLYQRQVG
jgi:hypothetical protein